MIAKMTEDEYDILYDFIAYQKCSSKNKRRVILWKCKEHFTVQDSILMYTTLGSSKVLSLEKEGNFTGRDWKVVVKTEKERKRIIKSCHSSAHGM